MTTAALLFSGSVTEFGLLMLFDTLVLFVPGNIIGL